LAALNAFGVKSFINSPPTITGGLSYAINGGGAGTAVWQAVKVSNPELIRWFGKEAIPAILSFSATYLSGDGGGGEDEKSRVIQRGGHTVKPGTATKLGMTRDEARNAIEELKKYNVLPNDAQLDIWSNGDISWARSKEILDNLWNYWGPSK